MPGFVFWSLMMFGSHGCLGVIAPKLLRSPWSITQSIRKLWSCARVRLAPIAMRSYRLPLDLGCEGDPTVSSRRHRRECVRSPSTAPRTTATATQLASVNDWAAPRESARPCTLSIGSAAKDETGTLNSSTPDSQPSGPRKRLQEASASGSPSNHVVFGLWSADSS